MGYMMSLRLCEFRLLATVRVCSNNLCYVSYENYEDLDLADRTAIEINSTSHKGALFRLMPLDSAAL